MPRTFCERCVAKIKLCSSFKNSSLKSENYLKSFVLKINQEFTKSLPSASTSDRNEAENLERDDPELEQLLFDEKQYQQPQESPADFSHQSTSETDTKFSPKVKQPSEKLSELVVRKTEKPKKSLIKTEKVRETKATVVESATSEKDLLDIESSALYTEDEEQLDDDGGMFGEEIYDIMEIENEGSDNIYLDETGKQVLGDDEGEFILVNFKSSNEDLTEKDQFVVEELYDDDVNEGKVVPTRKKHVNRMPREIIEKYAQSTDGNQHMYARQTKLFILEIHVCLNFRCTKCVKVFSTRTNLIRHIQSHDGYKAYVCQICSKGFTQSGSLKQHMYIHSGER